jgi:hypothetical protein
MRNVLIPDVAAAGLVLAESLRMRTYLSLLSLLLVAGCEGPSGPLTFPAVLGACDGPLLPASEAAPVVSEGAIDAGRFDAAVRAWQVAKQDTSATYSYRVSTQSWIGVGTDTVLNVRGDVVVSREFTRWAQDATTGARTTTATWREDASQLGTHAEGAAVATLDVLYQRCADEVLTRDPDTNRIYFGTYASGVLAHCTYVPRECADDCSSGVTVEALALCQGDPRGAAR